MIPIFCAGGYDENSAGRMTSVRSSRRKLMTPMWKSGLNLAEIVRRQFGWQYDGSEARNRCFKPLKASGFYRPLMRCWSSAWGEVQALALGLTSEWENWCRRLVMHDRIRRIALALVRPPIAQDQAPTALLVSLVQVAQTPLRQDRRQGVAAQRQNQHQHYRQPRQTV